MLYCAEKVSKGEKATFQQRFHKRKSEVKVISDTKKIIRSFNKRKDTLLETVFNVLKM
jgi:hypothetical protein